MIEIINTCDFCKEVISGGKQVWKLGIVCNVTSHLENYRRLPDLKADACRVCAEKFRLVPFVPTPKVPPPEMTTAEKLEVIISEMVEVAISRQEHN